MHSVATEDANLRTKYSTQHPNTRKVIPSRSTDGPITARLPVTQNSKAAKATSQGARTHTGFLPVGSGSGRGVFHTYRHYSCRRWVSYRRRYLKQSSGTDRFRYVCKLQRSTLKLISRASGLSSSSPARKFAGPATRPDRLRVKPPIYLHCIRRWSRTRLRFCRCVCKRPNG